MGSTLIPIDNVLIPIRANRYDVSGVAPDRIQRVLERDWVHLIREKGVLDSPNYLKEKGKPVIALWGTCSYHTPMDSVNYFPFLQGSGLIMLVIRLKL